MIFVDKFDIIILCLNQKDIHQKNPGLYIVENTEEKMLKGCVSIKGSIIESGERRMVIIMNMLQKQNTLKNKEQGNFFNMLVKLAILKEGIVKFVEAQRPKAIMMITPNH